MEQTTTYDRRWWTLAVLCLSLIMVILGNTVLNVALPTLVRELGATSTQLQWMVDSYALVFAGLLLTGGALGDRFGRKGALQIGLLIFGLASVLSTIATSADHLIATRGLMGVGAALVMPATLSILTNVFPPGERARAIAIWAGLAGSGAAIGPIASGWLLEHFWWGSVFFLNLPIVVVAVVAGRALVPTSRDPAQPPLDPIGAVLSIVGLGALLYAIIEAPSHGWTAPETLGAFALALVVLGAFGLWEVRTAHPMLDLRFFHDRRFSSASAAITLVFFALFGTFFLLTQYLQLVQGYSAFEAGVRTLPMALVMMATAPNSAKVVERFGARTVIVAGLTTMAVGLALISSLGPDSAYGMIVLSLVVTAVGMGFTMPPATTLIMASLPLGKAGVGSAVNDTTRELGGALGVGVLGSLLASGYAAGVDDAVRGLPAAAVAAVEGSLGGALRVAEELGGPAGAGLADAARSAYVDGMSAALLLAAAAVAVAAGLVARFLPVTAPTEAGAQPREGEPAAAPVPAAVPAPSGDGTTAGPPVPSVLDQPASLES